MNAPVHAIQQIVPDYVPDVTAAAFHASSAQYRFLRGSIGSGKSVACVNEIKALMVEQTPGPDGVRRTRFGAIRNCFDDMTEILTEQRGWRLFKDLLPDEKVAQLSDGGALEFVTPLMHYAADYVGEMIGFENEGVDFLVTPDHRLNVSKQRTREKIWGAYEFKTAEECFGSIAYRVKRDAAWLGCTEHSEAFFEWLGFWFAEGYAGRYEYPDRKEPHWRCVISQKKEIEYLRDLFARAGLEFTESEVENGCRQFRLRINHSTKPLVEELAKCGTAITKTVPRWIMAAPSGHLRAFLHGYTKGDGTVRKEGTRVLHTSSRMLADSLQEMALKAGLVANINLKDEARVAYAINGHCGTTNADSYTVTLTSKAQPTLKTQGYAKKYRGWYRQIYAGRVYCLEVPTHRVYVRRNGRAHWSSQTYGELKSTTIKTWQDWFPPEICPIVFDSPIVGRVRLRNGLPDGTWDGTYIESEILFVSMDKPNDVKKLKSLDLTSLWLNEVSELPKAALDMGSGRISRYPPKFLGGPTRSCIIADTNPPDDDHWLYKLECEDRPEGFAFFVQPPALLKFGDGMHARYFPNPAATYARFQSKGYGYWLDLIPGKTDAWINVYVMGMYGSTMEGRPVYEAWNEHIHAAREEIAPMRGLPLHIGFDGGLTPAAIFGQITPRGRLQIIDELFSDRAGMKQFVRDTVIPHINANYAGMKRVVTYDPAMDTPDGGDIESSPSVILAANGLAGEGSPTNVFSVRKNGVDEFLLRMVDGGPGFLLSPKCKLLRKGFNGGYHFERVQVAGHERYKDQPVKNKWSHPHDALQYLTAGVLDGRTPSSSLPGGRFQERQVEHAVLGRRYG